MKVVRVCEHSFLPGAIASSDVVFDCGANRGDFSSWCSDNLDCQVYSFEPDPRLFSQLPSLRNVEFVECAISSNEAGLSLALGSERCSSGIYRESPTQPTVSVPSVSLPQFCSKRNLTSATIGLLKIDIEGAELDVLDHLPQNFLARTRQITVEFHDFLDISQIPRIRAVVGRLQACGFYAIRFSRHTWGDCLFLNRRMVAVSLPSVAKLILYDKYFAGVKRVLRRRFGGLVTTA